MLTYTELESRKLPLAVVGLGYVGLPLAVALAKKFSVIGFDISASRVSELCSGHDHTREVESRELIASSLHFTADEAELRAAKFIIVAVPTPIDRYKKPDLGPVKNASETVGRNLTPGSVVVYESTVYPGVTEEVCVPILEKASGLLYGRDFTVGYSPERINPGDKIHTLENIIKVVSGSDSATADLLEQVYGAVVKAGIHKASGIRVAEAAKVIENTQRDLNIALMNELAIIFSHMGIDTSQVLEAAATKWNFLRFTPGLVGGHCIGVDPYYLTFKAEELGYSPQVILAGRRINDGMGKFVAETLVKKMIRSGCRVKGSRVAVFGLTFKENVPDLRNTRVIDIIRELREYGVETLTYDPEADRDEARKEYGIELVDFKDLHGLSAIVLAVPHTVFSLLEPEILRDLFLQELPICVDIKGFLDQTKFENAGFEYWRL